MRTNPLSAFGRMSYSSHLVLYPLIGGSAYTLYSTWSKKSAEAQEKFTWDTMPVAKAVDPDLFQPFSALPFHNNVELHYRYANTKMFGYLNSKTHMNANDYTYKLFHDSYDHDAKKEYTYNWVSMVPADHVKA